MEFKYRLEGAKELQRQLNGLPGAVAGRVLRRATAIAARIIRDKAKAILRSRGYSSFTVKEVRVKTQRNPTPYTVRVEVGNTTDAYWLRFIELGTRGHEVSTDKKVLGFKNRQGRWVIFGKRAQVGPVRPNPWLRPAFDQSADLVVSELAKLIDIEIEKAVQRLK